MEKTNHLTDQYIDITAKIVRNKILTLRPL